MPNGNLSISRLCAGGFDPTWLFASKAIGVVLQTFKAKVQDSWQRAIARRANRCELLPTGRRLKLVAIQENRTEQNRCSLVVIGRHSAQISPLWIAYLFSMAQTFINHCTIRFQWFRWSWIRSAKWQMRGELSFISRTENSLYSLSFFTWQKLEFKFQAASL